MIFRYHKTKIALSLWLILCCGSVVFGQELPSDINRTNLRGVYDSLKLLPLDEAQVATVTRLELHKDRARLLLEDGMLYLAKPVAGTVTGAVFIGRGKFYLTPPSPIDRYQVRRFMDQDSIDVSFTAAYLRFTDATMMALTRQLDFRRGEIPSRASKLHKKIHGLLLEDRGVNLSTAILADLVNQAQDGFFFAVLEQASVQLNFPSYVIFHVDSRVQETVAAYQYFPHRVNNPFYTLCAYATQAPHDGAHAEFPSGDEEMPLSIRDYRVDLKLQRNGHVQARADLLFTPAVNATRLFSLDIFPKLKIDSVRTLSGDTLSFIKEKKQAGFAVMRDVALPDNKLVVHYSGKLLEQGEHGLYVLQNNQYWLPRLGYLQPATYRLILEVPEKFDVVATGRLEKHERHGNRVCYTWVNDTPMFGSAFAMGQFDSTSFQCDSSVVTVFSSTERTRSLHKQIAGDVANSLYFFGRHFGALDEANLRVVESPQVSSFSYPGVLFLSSTSFAVANDGVMESHRGHETAHQWWGNLVGWRTYHDQWLSEGLAEYSGALMNQFLFDGDDVFFETVQGWRNDLLERGHIGVSVGLRNFGFSKSDLAQSDGLEAGAIWLGRRLGEKHPVDYFLLVYEKGAYVFHMLRTMLRDFDTGSDARFFAMLAEYARTFRHERAGCIDFQHIAEKYLGEELDWFFQQWVYGVEVPTYIYSYHIDRDERKFWVNLQIEQQRVSAYFRAVIPVTVRFSSDEAHTRKIVMRGARKRFRLGPFEQAPKKVIFNDYFGVLAHVKRR